MAADARVAKRQRSFHTDDRGTFEDKPETVLHTTAGDIEKSPRSLNGLRLADSHAGDKLGQEGAESRTGSLIQSSRVVRLPGRDVNLQRARLWNEHDTGSVLFDIKLIGSDRSVPCSRFVLAEESVFFEKKFRNPDFSVADTAIELHDVEGETLLAVIGSLFTAELNISPNNLDAILQCAAMLQLPVVTEACADAIKLSLCEQSIPEALQTARRYRMEALHEAVLSFVKSNFFLMHRTSLGGLDRESLMKILSADDLAIFSEMQVYRAVVAWVDHHQDASAFEHLFKGTMRLQHLQPFEARSLLAEAGVAEHPAVVAAITESLLNRLEGSRPLSRACKRDTRRFVWAIDDWSDMQQQKTVRSPHFWLSGSEHAWSLSYTCDKAGFHLTCIGEVDDEGEHIPYSPLSGSASGEAVQLTMVLYHQTDYNRARRWRLPKCTLSPGEYQGFDWFFKDVEGWIRNDRIIVGVQLRLVGCPDPTHDDTAASACLAPSESPSAAISQPPPAENSAIVAGHPQTRLALSGEGSGSATGT